MAYTLRLDSKEDKKLKKVMKSISESTATKAIIQLIFRYESDQKELKKLREKTLTLENELTTIRELLRQKNQLEQEIKKYLT